MKQQIGIVLLQRFFFSTLNKMNESKKESEKAKIFEKMNDTEDNERNGDRRK